jgi:hypothetical protein
MSESVLSLEQRVANLERQLAVLSKPQDNPEFVWTIAALVAGIAGIAIAIPTGGTSAVAAATLTAAATTVTTAGAENFDLITAKRTPTPISPSEFIRNQGLLPYDGAYTVASPILARHIMASVPQDRYGSWVADLGNQFVYRNPILGEDLWRELDELAKSTSPENWDAVRQQWIDSTMRTFGENVIFPAPNNPSSDELFAYANAVHVWRMLEDGRYDPNNPAHNALLGDVLHKDTATLLGERIAGDNFRVEAFSSIYNHLQSTIQSHFGMAAAPLLSHDRYLALADQAQFFPLVELIESHQGFETFDDTLANILNGELPEGYKQAFLSGLGNLDVSKLQLGGGVNLFGLLFNGQNGMTETELMNALIGVAVNPQFAQALSESPELRQLILANPNLVDNLALAPELTALFASEELQAQLGNQVIDALLDPEAPNNIFTRLTAATQLEDPMNSLRGFFGIENADDDAENPMRTYIETVIGQYFAQAMAPGEDGEATNPFQTAIGAALEEINEARLLAIYNPDNRYYGLLNVKDIAEIDIRGYKNSALKAIAEELDKALKAIRNAQFIASGGTVFGEPDGQAGGEPEVPKRSEPIDYFATQPNQNIRDYHGNFVT